MRLTETVVLSLGKLFAGNLFSSRQCGDAFFVHEKIEDRKYSFENTILTMPKIHSASFKLFLFHFISGA